MQSKEEGRSSIYLPFGPARPRALNERLTAEADTGAFVFITALETLEDSEKFIGVTFIEADAIL